MPINATDGTVTITVKKKKGIDPNLQYILAGGRWLKDATGSLWLQSPHVLDWNRQKRLKTVVTVF